MKIVQYNDTYSDIGGTEVYCQQLMGKLSAQGHSVHLLSNSVEASRKGNIWLLPTSEGLLNTWRSKYGLNKKHYRNFKAALEQLSPDVVHIHQNRYHAYELLYALQKLKIPVVQTIHDYTILCPSQYYPQPYFKDANPCQMDECHVTCSGNKCVPFSRRIIYQFFHDKRRVFIRNAVNTFIAPTIKLKQLLEAASFENIEHLPFYIDPDEWSDKKNSQKENTIIFIGRVEENKGVLHLVESIKKLKGIIPDIELQIIGGGSQVKPLQMMVQKEGLDYIHIIGKVNHDTVKTYLAKAKICVVPSLDMEQFALVGIEAIASGTNVIGSHMGGIPEWCIHNQTGLLFDPKKEDDLLHQLSTLMQNPTLAEKLRVGGTALLKTHFDKKQHFDKLEEIYRQAKPLST